MQLGDHGIEGDFEWLKKWGVADVITKFMVGNELPGYVKLKWILETFFVSTAA